MTSPNPRRHPASDLEEALDRLVELLACAAAEEFLQGEPMDAEAPDADA